MKQPSLIALDLDGTLLDKQWEITPATRRAIWAVRQQGIAVTLATGRMFASSLPYARQLELEIPLITYQGALVQSIDQQQVLYQRFLPLDLTREVIQLAESWGLVVNAYQDDQLLAARHSQELAGYLQMAGITAQLVGDLRSYLQRDPIKLLVIGEELQLLELERIARSRWGNLMYITRSQPHFLEFLHPEATKARGLAALVQQLNLDPADVMVFGDSYNDLEMFAYAGQAIAMGNARPQVQAAADRVTLSNEEDGVAVALYRWVLKT